ncbi:hypothetical protein [Actinoallomurus sp. NPDC050550]|uniref:hypothetical protein n=1 Tax=Actinoallomurus sp. NPDC050550 TaxID=3154937 RepID=UPI0033F5A971
MIESAQEAALGRLLAVRPLMEEGPYGGPTDGLCAAIENLMVVLGSEDIADLVADAVVAGRTSLDDADIYLGVAAWSGTENGASMQRTLESWLRDGEDVVRVHLALHSECYPFRDANEMVSVLSDLAQRLPQFRERYAELIASRSR